MNICVHWEKKSETGKKTPLTLATRYLPINLFHDWLNLSCQLFFLIFLHSPFITFSLCLMITSRSTSAKYLNRLFIAKEVVLKQGIWLFYCFSFNNNKKTTTASNAILPLLSNKTNKLLCLCNSEFSRSVSLNIFNQRSDNSPKVGK